MANTYRNAVVYWLTDFRLRQLSSEQFYEINSLNFLKINKFIIMIMIYQYTVRLWRHLYMSLTQLTAHVPVIRATSDGCNNLMMCSP